ncbi:MAG TPA: flagellar biosynthetic protein FliR [Kofleriaceae bacterium]|nr:flagellar biosynthetic protein FliR [Kofleriaceae bacterium]
MIPTITEPTIGAFIVVLLRVGAVAMTAPVIGDGGVPARAKLVLAVSVALAISANHPGVMYVDLPRTAILELASGVITGLTASFVLARVAVAGQVIGLVLGLGFAQEFDPNAGESAGVIRMITTSLAGLAFLAANGLEALVRGVATPATVFALGNGCLDLLRVGTAAFGQGLSLAAPIMLAALVTNVGLAVMNRAAPAMNVFSVALSAVLALGTTILLASSGSFVSGIAEAARQATQVLAP